MAKILRLTDRIKITIEEITFTISPLSHQKKLELANCTKIVDGENVYDLFKAQTLYLKNCLKDIEGVEGFDGEKYELEFDGDELTDDCLSEVLNLEQRHMLTSASWQLLNGYKELLDPITGEKLDGVSVEVVSKGK